MEQLFRAGATLHDIGRYFGLTRQRIQQILKKRGITARDGGATTRAASKHADRQARLEARCMEMRGCTREQYLALKKIGCDAVREGTSFCRTPIGAFYRQRANAKRRGIPWQLKLGEWWQIWQQSGKWDQRGRGDGFCMARFGDKGPYAAGNIYITTSRNNASDQYLWRPHHWAKATQKNFCPKR